MSVNVPYRGVLTLSCMRPFYELWRSGKTDVRVDGEQAAAGEQRRRLAANNGCGRHRA